jgi:ketopantoate reductase
MGLLSKAASRGIRQIEEELIQYHTSHGAFNGIIFETPENTGYRDFNDQVSAITASFALTLLLPRFRCLILFPSSIDTELVAHIISKILKTEACFLFESESPGWAFEILKPYL